MEHRLLAFVLLAIFTSTILFSLLEDELHSHTVENYPVDQFYFHTITNQGTASGVTSNITFTKIIKS